MRELVYEQDQAAGLKVTVQMDVKPANEAEGKILELAGQLSELQMNTKVGSAELLHKIGILCEACSDLEEAQKSKADYCQVEVECICLNK
jgi:hypothetical protein